MNLTLFLVGILPLVLYVIIDIKYGLKAGIIAAFVAVGIFAGYMLIRLEQFDPMILVELLFLLALGGVSMKLNDSKYFKLQPMIMGLIITIYMAYMQIFVEPLLVRYMPMMAAMDENMKAVAQSPQMKQMFANMSLHLIPVFLIHALITGYAAIKLSNIAWLITRISIWPIVIIVALIEGAIFGTGFAG